ncbi:MAG: hypothetical protein Q7T05_07470 [Dehalococcoidia bacterium]|nr:hypothetical protein [Dehalococcoidia bacterium]
MAHGLWLRCEDEWGVLPMTDDQIPFGKDAPVAALDICDEEPAVLLRTQLQGEDNWVLLTGQSKVRVNGRKVWAGIRVLRDWDEPRARGDRIYYSTEELAKVEPFVSAETQTFCVRCKQEITGGHPSVACPRCDAIYHQDESGLNCFTYRDTCQRCGGPTNLGDGYSRTPEDI